MREKIGAPSWAATFFLSIYHLTRDVSMSSKGSITLLLVDASQPSAVLLKYRDKKVGKTPAIYFSTNEGRGGNPMEIVFHLVSSKNFGALC